MDRSSHHLELVRRSLYGLDQKAVGCFSFDKAGEQVQAIGPATLPALEQVLREETASAPLDPVAQHAAFPGLPNTIVVYLQLIKKEKDESRAARFVSALRGAALVEAIRYISIEWDRVIPGPFLAVIQEACQGLPEVRDIARWALERHEKAAACTGVSSPKGHLGE